MCVLWAGVGGSVLERVCMYGECMCGGNCVAVCGMCVYARIYQEGLSLSVP